MGIRCGFPLILIILLTSLTVQLELMNKPKFTPFPILETERLVLRQLEDTDSGFIYSLRTAPENNLYIDMVIPQSTAETDQYIAKMNHGISEDKYIYWVITLKESRTVIGTICLWNFVEATKLAELGYELHQDFQKQGYMREAFGRVVQYAIMDLELSTLEAYTHENNDPSVKLLEHYDFDKVGSKKEVHSRTDESYKLLIYRKIFIAS